MASGKGKFVLAIVTAGLLGAALTARSEPTLETQSAEAGRSFDLNGLRRAGSSGGVLAARGSAKAVAFSVAKHVATREVPTPKLASSSEEGSSKARGMGGIVAGILGGLALLFRRHRKGSDRVSGGEGRASGGEGRVSGGEGRRGRVSGGEGRHGRVSGGEGRSGGGGRASGGEGRVSGGGGSRARGGEGRVSRGEGR